MPNLNDENLKPVSFSRGGLTHGGQVHLEGTYAYLPAELADLSSDEQVLELGAVYFEPGIRRGFAPASESYLAGEYQRRIANDLKASDENRRRSASIDGQPIVDDEVEPAPDRRVITGGHSTEVRELTRDEVTLNQPGILPGGVDPHSGEIPAGYTLQNPVTAEDIAERQGGEPRSTDPASPHTAEGGSDDVTTADDQRDAEGNLPVHYELSTATTDEALTPSEKENADAHRKVLAEPFEGAYDATIEQTRVALANASDAEVQKFIEWEQARTDRAPRKTLLKELGADDEE